jgi:predicted phage terminase large subunit-like protein
MNLAGTVDGVRMLSREWPEAGAKYIEDKANGPAVMEILQDEIPGMIPVQVGQTEGDKLARLHAVSPTYESHHVFVPDPKECPWITDVINEWCTAPNAAGWDNTDAMTQALSKMQRGYGGLFELYKEQAAAIDVQRRRLAAEAGSGAQPQEEKDKAFNRLGRASMTATVKDLGKVMTADETPGCPKCGNKYPAATAEGHRKCGVCTYEWTVDVGRMAKVKQGFTARR